MSWRYGAKYIPSRDRCVMNNDQCGTLANTRLLYACRAGVHSSGEERRCLFIQPEVEMIPLIQWGLPLCVHVCLGLPRQPLLRRGRASVPTLSAVTRRWAGSCSGADSLPEVELRRCRRVCVCVFGVYMATPKKNKPIITDLGYYCYATVIFIVSRHR